MKRVRRPSSVDPERLTTTELLAAYERVFGTLSPEAKRRLLGAMPTRPTERGQDSTYVLAA